MALFAGAGQATAGASVDADGTVTIHPGETISIVFAGDNDLSHPKPASDPGAPSTMTFAFKDQTGLGKMLEVQSHLGVTVKYDAVMTMDGGRSGHTSSCPVLAGKFAIENWMDPITELKLSGFRKIDGSMVCN